MKLYFYFLESNKIRTEECEVEESPKTKTYRPINEFPKGYYGSYVSKENIGVMKTHYSKVIIFAYPNFEKAKEMFCKYLSGIVETMKENLSEYEEQLNSIETSTSTD